MAKSIHAPVLLLLVIVAASCRKPEKDLAEFAPGIAYTNHVAAEKPWSIYIVRVKRMQRDLELRSTHAFGTALGLSTLSDQIKSLNGAAGNPLAGVNGDFYQRDRAYAGDPRGLQIIDGEIISAPMGGAALWMDADGAPHAANVQSRFTVTWPNGATNAFGLNEERSADAMVIYTPAAGGSTHTSSNGLELILERADSTWLPLRAGEAYSARVREVNPRGNTPLTNGVLVLSAGPKLLAKLPAIQTGAVLKISTATSPDVRGARTAISGGPLLLREGKRLKIESATGADPTGYSVRSMFEQHPRSAIGWNETHIYLVGVDGRQKSSVGMTLKELASYMLELGCTDAMNLDGGGSATFWCNGRVVNNPCDKREREIANALVVTRKTSSTETPTPR